MPLRARPRPSRLAVRITALRELAPDLRGRVGAGHRIDRRPAVAPPAWLPGSERAERDRGATDRPGGDRGGRSPQRQAAPRGAAASRSSRRPSRTSRAREGGVVQPAVARRTAHGGHQIAAEREARPIRVQGQRPRGGWRRARRPRPTRRPAHDGHRPLPPGVRAAAAAEAPRLGVAGAGVRPRRDRAAAGHEGDSGWRASETRSPPPTSPTMRRGRRGAGAASVRGAVPAPGGARLAAASTTRRGGRRRSIPPAS